MAKQLKPRRANKLPTNPCGECKFYEALHDITPKLSEGWCRVSTPTLVLSEETCEKWNPKT